MANVYNIVTKLTDQVSPGLKTMQQNIASVQNTTKTLATGFKKIGTVLAGGLGIGIAAYGLLSKAMDEQQQSDTKLRAGVEAYGEQIGYTSDQIDALYSKMKQNAGEIQDNGLFGDEALQDAESMALQMGVNADSIRDLTQASADLTAKQKGAGATSEDLLSNQKMLSAAVASGTLPAAKKLGITFTDLEKKQFAAGNETERMNMLMNKFKEQGIAGLDEQMRNTTIGGHIKGIQNNIGDCIQEVARLVFSLGDVDSAGDVFAEIDNTVLWLKNTLTDCSSPAEALVKVFSEMKAQHPVLTGIAIVIGTIAAVIAVVTAATTAWTIAVGIFNAVMALNPAVLIIMGIIAAIVLCITYWDEIKDAASAAIDWISDCLTNFGEAAAQVWEDFKSAASAAIDAIKGFFYDLWSNSPFGKVFNAIKNVAGGMSVGDAIKNAVTGGDTAANGTGYAQGGPTVVGEYGPELVNLPRGSVVKNNAQTRRELSGDGNNVTVNVNISGNVVGNDDFINQLGETLASRVRLAICNM